MNFFIRYDDSDNIAPSNSQIEAQCHPFNRECRAYARLKEVGKEHLAVKCYGYLLFDKSMEQALADQFDLTDWGRDPEYYPKWDKQPLHAIVKDFLPPADFLRRDAPKISQDLKDLHQCGIVVNDVKYDAYVGRCLVDFSFAVTAPHIQFDKRFRFNHSDPATPRDDLDSLEDVFRHWNYLHPSQRKIKTCDRGYVALGYSLRSRKEPYDPRDFDWKACANQWTMLPRKRRWRRAAADYGQRKKKKPKRSVPPSESDWRPIRIAGPSTESDCDWLRAVQCEISDNIREEYMNWDSDQDPQSVSN